MEFIKTLYIDDAKIEEYNRLMSGPVDYDAHDLKSDATVDCWTVKFPKGLEMDIKVCSGQRYDNDPLWTEGVLFRKGSEISHTDVEEQLDTDFQCSFDNKHLYTVRVVPKSQEVKNPTEIIVNRAIPAEKAVQYEAMFTKNLIRNKPAASTTAFIHSTWVVYFPGNVVIHVQVCSENNKTYARAVLRRNNKKSKPIYSPMRDTLKEPFQFQYNKTLYTVNLIPKDESEE